MDIRALEAALHRDLPIKSVEDIAEFPCANYGEFLAEASAGDLEIVTSYDPNVFPLLSTRGEQLMHYALTWSSTVIALLAVVGSIRWSMPLLLLAVPAAYVGALLTSPALMRIGAKLWIATLAIVVIAWVRGEALAMYLSGAYALSYYFTGVAREQCDMYIRESIGRSEIVFVWLYLKGRVVVKSRYGIFSFHENPRRDPPTAFETNGEPSNSR